MILLISSSSNILKSSRHFLKQVSSGLSYSSKQTGWSEQCYSLYGFDSSSYSQFLKSFFQALGDRSNRINKY